MIASRFRSVWMGGLVIGAALGCYLTSQRVASERAALTRVDRQIAATQRDIRMLSTELVTRTRMPQLERWNVAVLGLTAPGAGQFLDSEIRLASLDGRDAMKPDPARMDTQGAVQTVSYTPAKPAEPAATATATDADPDAPAPAPAPARAPQPALRTATFVRAKAPALDAQPVLRAALRATRVPPADRSAVPAAPAHGGIKLAAFTMPAFEKSVLRTDVPDRAAVAVKPKASKARAASLLPEDIGALAADERGSAKSRH